MQFTHRPQYIGPALNLSILWNSASSLLPHTYTATYCPRIHHTYINMVSHQHVHPPSSKAPWRPLFQCHISILTSPEFSLATVYRNSSGSAHPRVRTCVFRGFWTELDLRETAKELLQKDEESNRGGINPNVFESDLLTFTTDIRMEKIAQMASTDGADRGNGASGGGPIEAVFWVKDAMMQWRIKGRAFVIGNESCDAGELWSRENIQRWVRRREGSAEEDITRWTWEKEITANFANLSPTMRGSFKNPSPGTPRSEPPSDPSLKLGLTLDDIHDPVARANFRVVVIVPEEVESVDLTSPENFKRMRWALTKRIEKNEDSGEAGVATWEATELWP
ncbi:pyridoxamine 5'-phosphate oxidase domain protein [Histoplasma capsulatum var. duboisii H88]|uniref:Pyridoxamine 5'-phosphate oxidase domain protein n=1 Tax=Ajellomyces capsulatus (strain H88) TaxID=544711 RepID=A0A8A1LMK5_AJEC8|nr:pyridoxamine 5'-phosphate oxidase domain protein [Histoplasma capsulatum var. duboisii H88]